MITFALIAVGIVLLAFILTHPLSSSPPIDTTLDSPLDPKL